MSARSIWIGAALLLVACGSAEQAVETSEPPAAGETSITAGSCVEQYSLETLENRDYAFDGTVRSITPGAQDGADRVEFDVHAWYSGGSGARATRQAFGFAGVTSAGGSPHKTGERLLVAGDDDFVWECGFTQPYDAEVAADWDERLG